MSLARLLALNIGIVLFLTAQPPLRQWANSDEYELGSRALAQPDARQTLTLLQEWASRFPVTQFERERMLSFALAYYEAGDSRESLRRAAQALALDPADGSALFLISAVGPTIRAASDREIVTITAAAARLLSSSATSTPVAVPVPSEPGGLAILPDPQLERVLIFVRRLRAESGLAPVRDPEILKRQVAEAALEWAKNAAKLGEECR